MKMVRCSYFLVMAAAFISAVALSMRNRGGNGKSDCSFGSHKPAVSQACANDMFDQVALRCLSPAARLRSYAPAQRLAKRNVYDDSGAVDDPPIYKSNQHTPPLMHNNPTPAAADPSLANDADPLTAAADDAAAAAQKARLNANAKRYRSRRKAAGTPLHDQVLQHFSTLKRGRQLLPPAELPEFAALVRLRSRYARESLVRSELRRRGAAVPPDLAARLDAALPGIARLKKIARALAVKAGAMTPDGEILVTVDQLFGRQRGQKGQKAQKGQKGQKEQRAGKGQLGVEAQQKQPQPQRQKQLLQLRQSGTPNQLEQPPPQQQQLPQPQKLDEERMAQGGEVMQQQSATKGRAGAEQAATQQSQKQLQQQPKQKQTQQPERERKKAQQASGAMRPQRDRARGSRSGSIPRESSQRTIQRYTAAQVARQKLRGAELDAFLALKRDMRDYHKYQGVRAALVQQGAAVPPGLDAEIARCLRSRAIVRAYARHWAVEDGALVGDAAAGRLTDDGNAEEEAGETGEEEEEYGPLLPLAPLAPLGTQVAQTTTPPPPVAEQAARMQKEASAAVAASAAADKNARKELAERASREAADTAQDENGRKQGQQQRGPAGAGGSMQFAVQRAFGGAVKDPRLDDTLNGISRRVTSESPSLLGAAGLDAIEAAAREVHQNLQRAGALLKEGAGQVTTQIYRPQQGSWTPSSVPLSSGLKGRAFVRPGFR